jgi:hypothetical protein
MNPDETCPQFDSESVRVRAAWYGAGVNAFAQIVFVATLLVGAAWALLVAMFDISASEAVISFAVFQLLLYAGVGMYLGFRSRSIARTERVQVDQI